MKYQLDQLICYIKDKKLHSAPVLARMTVENLHNDWNSTDSQIRTFTPFGPACIKYATCHGIFDEEEVAASKEELISKLFSEEVTRAPKVEKGFTYHRGLVGSRMPTED